MALSAATVADAAATSSEDPRGDVIVNGRVTQDEQVAQDAQLGVLGDRGVFDTPFSTSGFTDQLIRDQQARALGDVLANDSSVRLATSRYAESESFTIRGFPVRTVLFNGLPGLADYRSAFLDGVERVEVFKGPSTLVNGSSQEVGGTINLVAKRAPDGGVARATVGYIGDAQAEAHLDVGGRWGADKEWGVRANAGVRYGDTPIDNQLDTAAIGTLALDHRGDRLRVSVDASWQYRRLLANLSGFSVSPGFAIPRAPDLDLNIFDRSSGFRKDNSIGLLSAEYDLTDAITAFAAYGHQHAAERYFGPYAPSIIAADGTTIAFVIPYVNTENADTARAGLRVTFATGPVKHQLTLSGEGVWDRLHAGFAFQDTLTTNIYAPVPFAPMVPSYPDPPVTYDSHATTRSLVFADVASLADDRVSVIAGVRRVAIASRVVDPTTGAVATDYDRSRWTPAVAVLVKPLPRLTLYGNYVQALQQGLSAPVGTVNAGEVFAPTVSEQYELGAKYEVGPAAGVTFAAFSITQPSGLVDPTSNRFSVNGEQRNRGLELNAFGELTKGLRLLAGASLIDAVQLRTADGEGDGRGDLDGKKAVGVPAVQVNAGAEIDIAAVPGLTLTGRVIYTGKEYYDPDESRAIPDATRVDLGVRYAAAVAGHPMTFRASVENAFDHDYWASTQNQLLALGAPRTVLLSVTRDF